MSIFSISYGYEISLLEGNVMKNSTEFLIELWDKYPRLRKEPILGRLFRAIRREVKADCEAEYKKCKKRLKEF